MGLGTKNRQKQTADICKQHLRERYRDQRGLVEEFILEFEGDRKNCDVTRWDQFTDIKDIKKEMLKRLEAHLRLRSKIEGEQSGFLRGQRWKSALSLSLCDLSGPVIWSPLGACSQGAFAFRLKV
jgi:hypothetical protein